MLSTVMGVYNFGRLYPKKFDYTFTLLEGRRLLRDASTSAGFYHAGFRAAANAIGFSPKRCDDELASSGWKQMDGAEEGPRKGGKSLASRIKKTKGRQRGHPLKTSYSRTKTTK
jgi:hypothetical protein